MSKLGQQIARRGSSRSSTGSTFVEVLIAITIMSIVALSLTYAIVNVVLGVNWVDQKTTVTGIARSQAEYVKAQRYADSYEELALSELPEDWTGDDDITIVAEDVVVGRLQRVTVTVSYAGGSYELQGLKVNR